MFLSIFETCPRCKGQGSNDKGTGNCPKCYGLGRIKTDKSVHLSDGQVDVLKGEIKKLG